MRFLDRRAIKRSARDLIRERGGGVLTVTFLYLLLTDVLTTLLNLVFTNPLVLIQDQWSQSLESILQPWLEAGGGPEPDLTPAYSATDSFARQTLFNPRQEAILFLFLLLFLLRHDVGQGDFLVVHLTGAAFVVGGHLVVLKYLAY